MQIERKGY